MSQVTNCIKVATFIVFAVSAAIIVGVGLYAEFVYHEKCDEGCVITSEELRSAMSLRNLSLPPEIGMIDGISAKDWMLKQWDGDFEERSILIRELITATYNVAAGACVLRKMPETLRLGWKIVLEDRVSQYYSIVRTVFKDYNNGKLGPPHCQLTHDPRMFYPHSLEEFQIGKGIVDTKSTIDFHMRMCDYTGICNSDEETLKEAQSKVKEILDPFHKPSDIEQIITSFQSTAKDNTLE